MSTVKQVKRTMAEAPTKVYDLLISGAGIAGASLALDAAQRGLSVALIDPRPTLIDTGDTRTTAFMPESVVYLAKLGLWQCLESEAQPLLKMRLFDDRDGRRGQPEALDFAQGGHTPLAYNLPNRALAAAQESALKAAGVDLFFGQKTMGAAENEGLAELSLEDGQRLKGRACFAADSRRSVIREALTIQWQKFSAHQTALTARLHHAEHHQGVSSEYHRHDGPMTFVPVAGDGHQSALVWCLSNETAEQLTTLSDEAFLARIRLASQGVVGAIDGVSSRAQFPVRPGMAHSFTKGPFALMAEAAHVLPPLLAQGLNLSLKDAEVAGAALGTHGPSQRAIGAYARQRWPDVAARLGISEGLNHLLTRSPSGLNQIYGTGRQALQTFPGLRRAAVKIGLRGVTAV